MDLVHSHIGLCVADAARSERFYVEGLGFESVSVYDISGREISDLLEIDKLEMHGRFVKRGHLVIELLQFEHYVGGNGTDVRPMNSNGLTHLAFEVDDVDDVQARLVEYGGSARNHTRVVIGGGADGSEQFGQGTTSVMCADPDGTRIELIKSAGAPEGKVGTRMCWDAS